MGKSCQPRETTRRSFLRTASAGTTMLVANSSVLKAEQQASPLPTRPLGKTGEQVPILGVGTPPAGYRSRKEAAELYSLCLDAGLTYFDTAPKFAGYGDAQTGLGDVLKTRRDEAFVATKCWESDGEKALKLLKSNLRDLRTDRADLVYAHAVGTDRMDHQQAIGKNGVMEALLKAQRDGLTRFIGITSHNRPQRCLDYLRNFEFQVMMNAVSHVSRHIYNFEEDIWPEAHRHGVALVAMKIYGGGKDKSGGRIKPPDLLDAFRYAQSLPNISTVVIGMYDQQEMAENLHFARTYQPLSQQELKDLLGKGKQLAAEWKTPFGPVT